MFKTNKFIYSSLLSTPSSTRVYLFFSSFDGWPVRILADIYLSSAMNSKTLFNDAVRWINIFYFKNEISKMDRLEGSTVEFNITVD